MHRPPPHNNSNEGLLVQATVVAMGANICGVICSLIKVQLILKPLATVSAAPAAVTTTVTTAAGQIQVKYEFSVFWTKSGPIATYQ